MAFNPVEFWAVVIAIVVFSSFFYKVKSLDFSGMVAAIFFGLLAYLLGGIEKNPGSLYSFALIVVFFIFGDLSTRLGRRKMVEKHERRTTENIIGNGGAALFSLLLQQPLAFHGAVASALADTMSSEIGMMSKQKPRLITTLQPVARGTDGGVTNLGVLASLVGGFIIAVFYFIFSKNLVGGAIIFFSGFLGSMVDSLLGAVFERRGKLDNMQVNFLACASGAIAAYLIGMFFGVAA